MKIRIPKLTRRTWVIMDVCVVGVILITVGLFLFRAGSEGVDQPKIPESMSSKLLFTPYTPKRLPEGFTIDKNSFTLQETALLFTASNKSGSRLIFSEQSVPKDLSMDEFYSGNITSPERLDGLKYKTIFGKLQGRDGTLGSVTTDDNTWILVTMPKQATKDDIQIIEQGLVKQ